jgi:hypothetical protein
MNRRAAPLPARSWATQFRIDAGKRRKPYEYAMYCKKLGRAVAIAALSGSVVSTQYPHVPTLSDRQSRTLL